MDKQRTGKADEDQQSTEEDRIDPYLHAERGGRLRAERGRVRERSRRPAILKAASAFLFLLLLIPVAAATFTDEWGQFQDDYSNRGFVSDAKGHFEQGIGTEYSIAAGTLHQPIVADIDEDGDLEIVITDGTYLQLYDQELTLIDEVDIGGTGTAQIALTDDWTGNGLPEIHVPNATSTLIYEYNGTAWNLTKAFPFGGTAGIQCGHYQRYCYRIDDTTLNKYNMTHNLSWTDATKTNVDSDYPGTVMAVDDLDRDDNDEISYVSDPDDNGNYGFQLLDTNGSGIPYQICGTDGLAEENLIASPVMYNMDGTGDSELVIGYVAAATTNLALRQYRPDCVEKHTRSTNIGGYAAASTFTSTVGILTGLTNGYACIAVARTGDDYYMYCASGVSDFYDEHYSYNTASAVQGFTTVVADMDSDGVADLVTPYVTYDLAGDTSIVNTSLGAFSAYMAVVDVDGDNELDLVTQAASSLIIHYSYFENANAQRNQSRELGRDGTCYSLDSPICVGTSVTWSADEDQHYTNDNFLDFERLISTCGINSSYTNGTLAYTDPQLTCTYDVIGGYAPTIYIQDDSNKDNFTEYWEIDGFSVINGTPGLSCNIPCSAEEQQGPTVTPYNPDDPDITSEEEIQSVVDTLTGQSALVEGMMVVLFSVLIVFGLARLGVSNPITYAMCVFGLWVVLAGIGILSWLYVVLFAFVSMALASIGFVLARD